MEDGVIYTVTATFNSSVVVEYEPPITAPYRYEDDGAGGSVLVNTPQGYVETEIISTKPVPLGVPDSPELEISRSFGTWETYQETPGALLSYKVKSIHVNWLPANDAEYYQVFLIANNRVPRSNAVLFSSSEQDPPLLAYTSGPLFDIQSDPLLYLGFEYTFGENDIFNRVNAFVFGYNELGRSKFPLTMMSFIAEGKDKYSSVNTLYIEKTSYSVNNVLLGESTDFLGVTTNVGGADENLESKAMIKYEEPAIPPPSGD